VEDWRPSLSVHETASCRLSLGGLAHGHGPTLQKAADELVARVLDTALSLMHGRLTLSRAMPLEPRVIAFLSKVAALSEQCGDVRARVLSADGTPPSRPT